MQIYSSKTLSEIAEMFFSNNSLFSANNQHKTQIILKPGSLYMKKPVQMWVSVNLSKLAIILAQEGVDVSIHMSEW